MPDEIRYYTETSLRELVDKVDSLAGLVDACEAVVNEYTLRELDDAIGGVHDHVDRHTRWLMFLTSFAVAMSVRVFGTADTFVGLAYATVPALLHYTWRLITGAIVQRQLAPVDEREG